MKTKTIIPALLLVAITGWGCRKDASDHALKTGEEADATVTPHSGTSCVHPGEKSRDALQSFIGDVTGQGGDLSTSFMTEDGEFLTVEIFDHPVPGRIVMWLATRSEDIARHTGMVRQYKGLYYLSMVDFRVQKNDDRWILLLDRHCQRGRGADRMVFSPMSTSGNWKTAIHQPGNSDALVLKQDGPEFCSINNDRAGRHPAMVEELMGYLGNGDTSSEVTVAFANDSGQQLTISLSADRIVLKEAGAGLEDWQHESGVFSIEAQFVPGSYVIHLEELCDEESAGRFARSIQFVTGRDEITLYTDTHPTVASMHRQEPAAEGEQETGDMPAK